MRPVTPFMMIPTVWMVFSLMDVLVGVNLRLRLFGALRLRSGGQRGHVDARLGQRAVEFLPPVRDIAGRAVAVEHAQGGRADVGQLMEDGRRDENRLPGGERHALLAEAHFTRSLDDEVDLFLFLV